MEEASPGHQPCRGSTKTISDSEIHHHRCSCQQSAVEPSRRAMRVIFLTWDFVRHAASQTSLCINWIRLYTISLRSPGKWCAKDGLRRAALAFSWQACGSLLISFRAVLTADLTGTSGPGMNGPWVFNNREPSVQRYLQSLWNDCPNQLDPQNVYFEIQMHAC